MPWSCTSATARFTSPGSICGIESAKGPSPHHQSCQKLTETPLPILHLSPP
ncbi:hypothetical protein Scep_030098 [Stephania cephalantha]|uniref:Uncharacterized protein n=1 Tax=Stephania cephalantha TaxID=152367 RepID=A0AAP0DZ17_9MAGN